MNGLSAIVVALATPEQVKSLGLFGLPLTWAFLLGAGSLYLLLPRGPMVRWQRALGGVFGVIAVGLLAAQITPLVNIPEHVIFWVFGSITVIAATLMISVRSPVYSAIWFAMCLLGVSSLFLFGGAQFLGVATMVVYAGAIVVMFLFLIMLAQPEGHEYYDRISWGQPAALFSAIAGASIVLMMTVLITRMDTPAVRNANDELAGVVRAALAADETSALTPDELLRVDSRGSETQPRLVTLYVNRPRGELTPEQAQLVRQQAGTALLNRNLETHEFHIEYASGHGILAQQHVASLGGELFSRHLIAVQVAGTLLLVALVGAVAIVIRGREAETN